MTARALAAGAAGAADVTGVVGGPFAFGGAGPVRVVTVTAFEPAVYVAPADRAAYERRFITLLIDEGSARRGGIGEVVRATSPRGERFAVKRLRADAASAGADPDAARALREAFRAEYDAHRRLGGLRGFPRLFGYGEVEDDPVIVMEWVEGVTLGQAARALAVDDAGRTSPLVAARIARDLFDLMARMALVEGGLCHRDVSPANVMVATARTSLADQVEEGAFNLVLIDFGSAAMADGEDPALTARLGARRGATADFAAPEMLTDDVPGMGKLRRHGAVDVYAAAGVLYALLEGHPPFDLSFAGRAEYGGRTPYRIKTEFACEPPLCAHGAAADVAAVLAREPEVAVAVGRAAAQLTTAATANRVRLALAAVDAQLEPLVEACLAPDQAARPTAAAMRDALAAFASQYADNVARALAGEPLLPCDLGAPARAARRRRRLRRVARAAVRALSLAGCVGVAASAGVLVNGMAVAFPAPSPWWAGPLPGVAAAALFALPGACALLARGCAVATNVGLALAVLADLLGAAAAGLLVALTAWPVPAVEHALYAALLLAATAPLPALVADRALTVPAPRGGEGTQRPRPVLPWGADPQAVLGLAPRAAADIAAAALPPLELSADGAPSGAPASPESAPSLEEEAVYELVDESAKEPA